MSNASIEYDILWGSQPLDVLMKVTHALADGWELQGGISVSFGYMSSSAVFAQAMIKRVPEVGQHLRMN